MCADEALTEFTMFCQTIVKLTTRRFVICRLVEFYSKEVEVGKYKNLASGLKLVLVLIWSSILNIIIHNFNIEEISIISRKPIIDPTEVILSLLIRFLLQNRNWNQSDPPDSVTQSIWRKIEERKKKMKTNLTNLTKSLEDLTKANNWFRESNSLSHTFPLTKSQSIWRKIKERKKKIKKWKLSSNRNYYQWDNRNKKVNW